MCTTQTASWNAHKRRDSAASSILSDSTQAVLCHDRLNANWTSYLSQILHGCKSAYCDTPTCLSSSKRNASKPHRPPTLLTAVALAHYLAGQDNPNRGLCPHELKVTPGSFEITNSLAQQARNNSVEDYAVYPSIWQLAQRRGASSQQEPDADLISRLKQRQQARKDPKALGQNLYDSLTMIYSYTTQIPTPTSVLASLCKPDASAHDAHRTEHSASQTDGRQVDASIEPTTRTNGHSSTSQLNRKSGDSSHSSNAGAAVLTNGHHVHRIPYHPSNGTTQRRSSSTPHPTVDGASDAAMLSISKTGKKNFTIGGTYPAAVHRASPLLVAPEPATKDTIIKEQPSSGVPVIPKLSCGILDELKEDVHRHRKSRSTDFNYTVDFDRRRRTRRTKPFVNRSLFYTLSDPEKLLASFHDTNTDFKDSPLPHLDSSRLVNSFRDWNHRNGALIFDSLWLALEALFIAPPELDNQKSPRLRPSRKGASRDTSAQSSSFHGNAKRYLDTHEAAHIVMICIHALTSLVPIGWPHTWAQIRKLRSWGVMVPNATPNTDAFAHPYMEIIDELEYEPALRLADRLLRAIGTRTCFEHILASLNGVEVHQGDTEKDASFATLMGVMVEHLEVVERVGMATKMRLNSSHDMDGDPGWTLTATFMEWLRTVIVKKWDSKAEINKWSSVGTAIMVLGKLRR
jgi:hypothetical protein